MKKDELLYDLMDELTRIETDVLDNMIKEKKFQNSIEQKNSNVSVQRRLKRQENKTFNKIMDEKKKVSIQKKDSYRILGKRRVVLLIATLVFAIGMVAYGRNQSWDIKMAERLGLSGVMQNLDGGYVEVGVSDTVDDITVIASQLIGDKNSMWLQLDTNVPWEVNDGGYMFEDSKMTCFCKKDEILTFATTLYSFDNNGYVSFMWEVMDCDNLNRATVEIELADISKYSVDENDEETTTILKEGKWNLTWKNNYAPNTVHRTLLNVVDCKTNCDTVDVVIREIDISPISVQIKGFKSPFDKLDDGFSLLEAVKLKDGTVISCDACVGGWSNFRISEFISFEYLPNVDMTDIEYVIVGGEEIKVDK